MDEILLNKPPEDQLKNTDIKIQTYISLLEKKLKNYVSLNSLHKGVEKKCFSMQDELSAIKLKNKEMSQQDEIKTEKLVELLSENTALNVENKLLKQQILVLTKVQQQHKNNDNNNIISKTKEVHQPLLLNNNVADSNDANANSVLVKGFTEQELNTIPKINIINLGRRMNLKVSEKDIVKVTQMERKYYERHNLKPNKIILIVQLRTPELKVEFLKNKEKLKSSFDDIEIIDYVSDDVFNLYQYAKILKSCGYALIYWRNNCVYAKKTKSSYCEPILIKSKNHVDSLKVVMKK